MRLASSADFEAGGLYGGNGWPGYRRYPFFAQRAAVIHQRFPSGKVLVVGCGWGYLVDELLNLGGDAWGVDASSYAINKGKALSGVNAGTTLEGLAVGMRSDTGSRLVSADATNRQQLASARQTAGLSGSQRFEVVVTEDVLPVLSDAEVSVLVTEVRRLAVTVLHIVSPGDPSDPSKLAGLNWKSTSQWKQLAAPDLVLDVESGAVV